MIPNSVEQTTTTTGTGTYSLTAPTDPLRQSFVSGVGSGKPVRYRATMGSDFEEGWGIATAGSPDTLTRNVTRSSNGNAAVNWGAGTKRIYCPPDTDALRFGGVGALPTSTGAANAQAVTHFPPLRARLASQIFRVIPGFTNTTTDPTCAVDGLTARTVKNLEGGLLWPGALKAGRVAQLLDDGTNYRLMDSPSGLLVQANNAGQTITSGSVTPITWATPSKDEIKAWDSGAATRLTMAAAGVVLVSASLTWGSAASSDRFIRILKNGAEFMTQGQVNSAVVQQAISAAVEVAAGDYIQIAAYQASASNLTMTAALVTLTVLR